MSKRIRTLDSFFSPPPTKRTKAQHAIEDNPREEGDATKNASDVDVDARSEHATYPFSLPLLPHPLRELLNFVPASEGKLIQDQPDLDLVYYTPFIPKEAQKDLFEFLRQELFFYRVKYNIKRGPVETAINTPRFTTVFGVDETARFNGDEVCHTVSGAPVPKDTYKCSPRPLPQCLDVLRKLTENATGCRFNFALVNYYADGNDSISYHSDDERFLGNEPSIASFTLGGTRDFLLKHKPTPQHHISETKPTKLPLTSGDMVLVRTMLRLVLKSYQAEGPTRADRKDQVSIWHLAEEPGFPDFAPALPFVEQWCEEEPRIITGEWKRWSEATLFRCVDCLACRPAALGFLLTSTPDTMSEREALINGPLLGERWSRGLVH